MYNRMFLLEVQLPTSSFKVSKVVTVKCSIVKNPGRERLFIKFVNLNHEINGVLGNTKVDISFKSI